MLPIKTNRHFSTAKVICGMFLQMLEYHCRFETNSTPGTCAYIFLRVIECRSLFRSAKQQVIVINVVCKKSNGNHIFLLKKFREIPRIGDLCELYRHAKELSSASPTIEPAQRKDFRLLMRNVMHQGNVRQAWPVSCNRHFPFLNRAWRQDKTAIDCTCALPFSKSDTSLFTIACSPTT